VSSGDAFRHHYRFKPKRDKLGPTGPAKISDDETKKGEKNNSVGPRSKNPATNLTSRIFLNAKVNPLPAEDVGDQAYQTAHAALATAPL
jgi:hypothetical protein